MKNNKGSVLVFFLLLAIPLILLLLTSVSLTRLMAARDEGRSALRIAVDGVMSEYDKNLYTEFGLLGVRKTNFDVGEYLFQQNLNPTDASGAPLSKPVMSGNFIITAQEDKNLGDMDLLLKQIKEFEKYMNLEEADDAGEKDELYVLNQNLHERAENTAAITKIRKKMNNLEIPDAMEQFVSGYSFSTASLAEENEKEEYFREIKGNEFRDGENVIFSGEELSGSEMIQRMSEEIMTLSTELLLPESISDAESENHRSVMNYIQMMFSSEHNRKSDDALRNECEQEYILYGNEKSCDNRIELARQIFEWRFMWEICLFEFSEEDEAAINKEALKIDKRVSEYEKELEKQKEEENFEHDDSVKVATKYYRDFYVIEKAYKKAYEDTLQVMVENKSILDSRATGSFEMTKEDYINLFLSYKIRTEEDLIYKRIQAVIDGYIEKKDGSGSSLKDYYSAVEGTADVTISVPGLPAQNMNTTWYEEY